MLTTQINQNIIAELSVLKSGLNQQQDRWEIVYEVKEVSLIGAGILSTRQRTITIRDTPETPIIDEDGNTIGTNPAGTDLTEFFAGFDGRASLIEQSELRAAEHANITPWDGTVIDDITNNPNAGEVQPWVVGELVAPPNKREYEGVIYDVIQPHTTQISWIPPLVPALFSVSQDQGGSGYPEWVQPTGAQDAYPLNFKVSWTVTGLCYENTGSEANVWAPNVFGWTVIPCI